MKHRLLNVILCGTVTSFAAGAAAASPVTNLQVVPFHVLTSNVPSCPGTNFGYAYLTNSAGTMWLKPTNCTSGTFTEISGFAAPYASAVVATRKLPINSWCDTNSVTFPVVSGNNYELYHYVKSSGLTNGQPVTLQVVWQ